MSQKAIFFDRDNTLLACDGYLGDPSKVALVDGAADAVAHARELGYATVVVSNQSGVGRGMFDEQAVRDVNRAFDQMLLSQNPRAVIDRHEFCPFHPEATVERYRCDSDLRKPKPGMILKAAGELDIDLRQSWLIGDAPRDIEAGKAAGCRTILLNDPSLTRSLAAVAEAPADVRADHTVASLAQAMEIVAGNGQANPGDPSEGAELPSTDPLPSAVQRRSSLEQTAEQILLEVRRRNEAPPADFSVSKLLAGIVQVLVLAVLFFAYIGHSNTQNVLLVAVTLQAMTIALLIMGRQR